MNQDKVFIDIEGDNYFKRNRKKLNQRYLKNDPVLKVISLFNILPREVFELGCANGFRLASLREKYHCRCSGIDCSKLAIMNGEKRYRGIRLYCADAKKLKFKSGSFDLAVVNFVFHWIDRKVLPAVISEVDRVLADKGFLVIGDFFPSAPTKNRYHHFLKSEIYTYKDYYSEMFEALGHYEHLGRLSGQYGTRKICIYDDSDNRFKVDLLRKDTSLPKKNE